MRVGILGFGLSLILPLEVLLVLAPLELATPGDRGVIIPHCMCRCLRVGDREVVRDLRCGVPKGVPKGVPEGDMRGVVGAEALISLCPSLNLRSTSASSHHLRVPLPRRFCVVSLPLPLLR